MNTLEEIAGLQSKLDQLKQRQAEATGALKQIEQRLKKEYGCKSLQEAKALLDKLLRDQEALRKKLDRDWAKFKKEYGDLLDEN